jgi:Pyruvate/2-oxoacid:ferredoxin oxidoreductase delta subunit
MDERPVVAVICDQACHPGGALDREGLKRQLAQSKVIGEIRFLENACKKAPPALEDIRGKKILFGGCPILEEQRFYEQTARQLDLPAADYAVLDVKASILDRYAAAKGIEQNLGRRLESLAGILCEAQEYTDRFISPNRRVLVYGSGLSGLSTALELAKENLSVDVLATPEPTLSPGCLAELLQNPDVVDRLLEQAKKNANIVILPEQSVKQITAIESGFVITTERGGMREYGTIIFAPERQEQLNGESGFLTLSRLYADLRAKRSLKGLVVFLLDYKAESPPEIFRDVLLAAKYIKEKMYASAWILMRNARVALPALQELYDECRNTGILFIRYEGELEIQNDYGDIIIRGRDSQSAAEFVIEYPSRLILPGQIGLPAAAQEFASALNLRLPSPSYSQPDSLWRLPNETNRAGVFAAGAARGNMEGQGIREDAVSLLYNIRERLYPEGIKIEEHIPVVDKEKCAYCLTCVRVCPFGAMVKDIEERVAMLVKSACKACGICVAECPAEAIQCRNLSNKALRSGISSLA